MKEDEGMKDEKNEQNTDKDTRNKQHMECR